MSKVVRVNQDGTYAIDHIKAKKTDEHVPVQNIRRENVAPVEEDASAAGATASSDMFAEETGAPELYIGDEVMVGLRGFDARINQETGEISKKPLLYCAPCSTISGSELRHRKRSAGDRWPV